MSQRLVPILLVICIVMFGAAPFVIDTAPYESTMGLVQRIFYFHFPAAMTMLVTAVVCGIASGIYLWKEKPAADRIAVASAELASIFGAIVLVTGPLWARKAWGVWWVWDTRITSTFVMWMVFNAYLLLRRFGGSGSETLAAAAGFFGMLIVPFIYWSVNFFATLHPKTSVVPKLPFDMGVPLVFCWIAFTVLYFTLMVMRVRLERSQAALEQLYLSLED